MSGALTLALEAATSMGSVAILRGRDVLASREVAMRGGAEERLLPAIDGALTESGATTRELERIVCGAGPGSFTSLRVSASLAKGIAFAHSIPLYAVPSLALKGKVDPVRAAVVRGVRASRSREAAMAVDGLHATRPVEFPVGRPEEAEGISMS